MIERQYIEGLVSRMLTSFFLLQIPGNFVTKDGKTPFVESRVKSGILLKYRDV
jgi:hypothetical protein